MPQLLRIFFSRAGEEWGSELQEDQLLEIRVAAIVHYAEI